MTPTPEQLAGWAAWLADRPAAVRAVAERFPPWNKYLLTTTNHICSIYSFGEPVNPEDEVTMTVTILYADNPGSETRKALFEAWNPGSGNDPGWMVFGIKAEDLIPSLK